MSVVPSSPPSDPLQSRMRQLAEAALVVGDYDVAEKAARTVYNSHPNAANTALFGRVYYFWEKWELAQPYLELVPPTNLSAQIMLGWIHVFLGLCGKGEEAILLGQSIHTAALSKLDHSLGWLEPHLALMNYNYLVVGQDPTLGSRWSKARLAAAALEIGNYAAVNELTENNSSLLFHRARLFYHWGWWERSLDLLDELELTPSHLLYRGWCGLLIAQEADDRPGSLAAVRLIVDGWGATIAPPHRSPARRLLSRRKAHAAVLHHRGFSDEASLIHPSNNATPLPRLRLPDA